MPNKKINIYHVKSKKKKMNFKTRFESQVSPTATIEIYVTFVTDCGMPEPIDN